MLLNKSTVMLCKISFISVIFDALKDFNLFAGIVSLQLNKHFSSKVVFFVSFVIYLVKKCL